jgi:hypothetical protein
VQGKSNGERASEFAPGGGKSKHDRLDKQQVARGGSNPNAGPKPKNDRASRKPEKPGPKKDTPKPNPQNELMPFPPLAPDLTSPGSQRDGRVTHDPRPKEKDGDDTETQLQP